MVIESQLSNLLITLKTTMENGIYKDYSYLVKAGFII